VIWTNLLANKEAQKHKTSKKELAGAHRSRPRRRGHCRLFRRSEVRDCLQRSTPGSEHGDCLCGISDHEQVGHHRVSLESTNLVLGKLMHKYADYFENLWAKAEYDRLHLLQRCDGDGSEGDPRRNRRFTKLSPCSQLERRGTPGTGA
jgi:hypothetical protein